MQRTTNFEKILLLFAVSAMGFFAVANSAQAQNPEENATEEESGALPATPLVVSNTFPQESAWYRSTNATFSWLVPEEVTAVAVELSSTTDSEPERVFSPTLSEYVVEATELNEGIQYLQVQFRNEAGWGDITSYPIRIDNSSPKSFSIWVRSEDAVKEAPILFFSTEDTVSGVESYEIVVNGDLYRTLTAEDMFPAIALSDLPPNLYIVEITAYDSAGNTTSATTKLEVSQYQTSTASEGTIGLTTFIFAMYPLMVLLLTLFFLRHLRNSATRQKHLLEETIEVKTQMAKMFGALKDEMHDQIQTITRRKKLSKQESEAIANLKRALTVSETLIKKEVDDVKDLLK